MNTLEAQLAARPDRADSGLDAASARLRDAATREGLVDVAYAHVDSPIGRLLAAVTRAGLVRLAFETEAADPVLADLAAHVSPRVLEAPARVDTVRRELDEYFAGRRQRFDVPIDWSLTRGFRARVLQICAAIPYGQVRTYKDMALAAGNAGASRAAGSALGSNPVPIVVPCHRVLRTGGGLGGYGGGLDKKELLLRLEGVTL